LDQIFCIFQPIFKNKHVLEAQIHKQSMFDDFYFQNGGSIIQDGVFQIFYVFLSSGVLNCERLNFLFQNMIYYISINKSWKQSFNKKTRW
jgi:hypothetical protein